MYESLIHRHENDAEWQKIPWHDPDFSRRMLREHLSQEHDAASRRTEKIDHSVQWIQANVLGEEPVRILDLGCGPGLYTHRFTRLGHECIGIDFGPASIAYANEHHDGEFILGDVLTAEYGPDYDLVCMLYGELNAFSPRDAQAIIDKAYAALKPGGTLLLEVSTAESIEQISSAPPIWRTEEAGLFSDEPYVILEESRMNGSHSESWFYVIDAATGKLTSYVAMHQRYTVDEYREHLQEFSLVMEYPSITGNGEEDAHFFVLTARK